MRILISAFPGTGKSYEYKRLKELGYRVLDSDSSTFDKSQFPQNYIDYIKSKSKDTDIQFISSHQDVREALRDNNIAFICVIPDINLKDEYLKRYKGRGNNEAFIKLLDANWDNWIDHIKRNTRNIVTLKSGEYISNLRFDRFIDANKGVKK